MGHIATHLSEEDGFSLPEALMSMVLLAIVFVALAGTITSVLGGLNRARRFQQATALGNQLIEEARDLSFDDIILDSTDPDLAANAEIVGSPEMYDPDRGGPLVAEEMVLATTGAVITHRELITVDSVDYEIRRYVTWVDDSVQGGPDRDYKRFQVTIGWNLAGATHEFTTSTFLTAARRGLPAPKFDVLPDEQTLNAEPGTFAIFTFEVLNTGIVDTYDITVSLPPAEPWVPLLFLDVDGDRAYTSGVDPMLTDSNGNGTPDTGSIATGEAAFVHLGFNLQTSPAGFYDVELTATSGADGTTAEVGVGHLVVGTAGTTLWLHHDPTPAGADASQTKINYRMNETNVLATDLWDYDTTDSNPGRAVTQGGDVTTTNPRAKVVNWVYQAPDTLFVEGPMAVSMWVAADDFLCPETLVFDVFVRIKNSANTSNGVILGSVDDLTVITGTAGCGWEPLDFSVSLPFTTVDQGDWIEIKIVADSLSTRDAMLAFDTVDHPAIAVLPTVNS